MSSPKGVLGTVTITESTLRQLPYLDVMVRFHPKQDNRYQLIPAVEWGRSTAPLKEIIRFIESGKDYRPPMDAQLLMQRCCLGQFLTLTTFVELLCRYIGIPSSFVTQYTPRSLGKIIRDKVRSVNHYKKIEQGVCSFCLKWLYSDDPDTTPCCRKPMHGGCWVV